METLQNLFENNRRWAQGLKRTNPRFFEDLARLQAPAHLWIGCSDSRVPANDIVGLLPGELFVHRNVANIVAHADINLLAVLQYAVDVLGVRHIIVCGHYGCGGVDAAMQGTRIGLVDHWLRHVRDVQERHQRALDAIADPAHRFDRLCELNVIEQFLHVCRSPVVRTAWERGRPLSVHGWIYSLADGLLRNLGVCATGPHEIDEVYRRAVGGG
jgi:carbonic anhydrase